MSKTTQLHLLKRFPTKDKRSGAGSRHDPSEKSARNLVSRTKSERRARKSSVGCPKYDSFAPGQPEQDGYCR
jgi:hypothetical protein